MKLVHFFMGKPFVIHNTNQIMPDAFGEQEFAWECYERQTLNPVGHYIAPISVRGTVYRHRLVVGARL